MVTTTYCVDSVADNILSTSPVPICMKVKVAPSRPTLCNPMDYTVHGILQAVILE